MAGANTPKPIEIIGGDGNIYVVDTWNRGTIADGNVMTDYTIRPICSAIQGGSQGLSAETERAMAAESAISAVVVEHYDEYKTFETNVYTSAESFSARLAQEISDREDGDDDLQEQIDTLKAATDVIMVYGTYADFTANSASPSLGLTDADVIKVLVDESTNNEQVYYQWYDPQSGHEWSNWSAIGSLNPYYSKSKLNDAAGKNINITTAENDVIKINTNDYVTFSAVSSSGFSGKNLSGASRHDTIDNLFGSAYSGAEASAWIYANSAILDIQPGYGLTYSINEQGNKVIGIIQDHCDYYKNVYGVGLSLALGTYSTAWGSYSYAFGESCKTSGGKALAIGDNAYATTGAIALGTLNSANGKYSLALGYNTTAFNEASVAIGKGLSGEAPITLGTWNDNVAGATFIIGDGTGTQEGHDVVRKNALVIKDGLVSGRDFSAGNVSLSSLTNISAFGNGITNTATYNLSAIKLSAGQGISFKNDTNGVLSISAEGRAYTGENYVKVDNTTKKISITGNLITSANAGSAASAWVNNTLFDYSYYGSVDPETASGSIDKIKILYKNDADSHDTMLNQEIVFSRGNYSVSGLLIQAANNTDNGKVLTYNTAHNNYTWQEIPNSNFSNDDGYISIDNQNRTINLSTTGIKTSAYSAEFIDSGNHYNAILNGDSLYFGYGHSTLNISLTGVSYYSQGTPGSANWDNLFRNYAQVNRNPLSDSNLTADRVNFIVATGSSGAQPYKAVNFVVTSTLPTILADNTYYIV